MHLRSKFIRHHPESCCRAHLRLALDKATKKHYFLLTQLAMVACFSLILETVLSCLGQLVAIAIKLRDPEGNRVTLDILLRRQYGSFNAFNDLKNFWLMSGNR